MRDVDACAARSREGGRGWTCLGQWCWSRTQNSRAQRVVRWNALIFRIQKAKLTRKAHESLCIKSGRVVEILRPTSRASSPRSTVSDRQLLKFDSPNKYIFVGFPFLHKKNNSFK